MTKTRYTLIEKDADLVSFMERCTASPYLAIDTEFLREKTYYAKLCLVQIAIKGEIAIIDPFTISDLSVMAPVLANPDIVKVFHACSQDVEILFHETGVVPTPIFDTQIAGALLGKTQQASYASLVSAYCQVNLPKKDSFTDWSRRPLATSQVTYAADDVAYLPKIYRVMVDKLTRSGRLNWLDEAFEELSNPDKYRIDPMMRYRKLKRVNQLSPRQAAAAREFAAWRERRAQNANIPRKWVVSDEQIVEACRREAKTVDELYMVRGLRDSLKTEDARSIVACIKRGLNCPEEDLPQLNTKSPNEQNVDIMVDIMNALVHLRSSQNHIAPQTLAAQSELMKLARGHYDECELMKGWRYKLIGKELLDLLKGRFSLRIVDGDLEIIYGNDTD